MKEKIKKNYKIIIGVVIGLFLSGVIAYAEDIIVQSSNVSYDNSTSGLTSTTLKGALDELYEKSDIRKMDKFVSSYTYNASTCVTGEESTCVKSTCYKNKIEGSCKAGDIIKYKVNDTDIVTFHVMYDNGSTLTMQSHNNTVSSIQWISKTDYVATGGEESDYGNGGNNSKGPITALTALEKTTASWSNVNNQIYTMGTTPFKTGCTSYNSCETNVYTLEERTAKARMITVQEANKLGCTSSSNSCPKWMATSSYWTMSAYSSYSSYGWHVSSSTSNIGGYSAVYKIGARAVVVVSK